MAECTRMGFGNPCGWYAVPWGIPYRNGIVPTGGAPVGFSCLFSHGDRAPTPFDADYYEGGVLKVYGIV